ncbi:MAG: hypothetical protein MUE81_17825 [Thermoflexibacter sp.]|nr:hypothetical protein [Thermoflexibacter sp.]
MRNFENWETQDIEMTFGIQKVRNMPLLNDWLSAIEVFNEFDTKRIERLREQILEFADYWNEDELKMQCISVILDIVDYKKKALLTPKDSY